MKSLSPLEIDMQIAMSKGIRPVNRTCPHPFCGCVSVAGWNGCSHEGPCQPLDREGRKFTISYIDVEGQRLMCKEFERPKRPSLIDADVLQAASGIQGAATAIQGTIFRDAEPFDAKKAVTDIVGS